MQGDFATDAAIGGKIDLKVPKKANEKSGKTYTNVETHPSGSLITATESVPPTVASATNDVPF